MDPDDQCLRGLKILAVSPIGGYHGFNTSIHRVRALEQLGATVGQLDTAQGDPTAVARRTNQVLNALFQRGLNVPLRDTNATCARLLAAVERENWDWIWLEKSLRVGPAILSQVRRIEPKIRFIGFSPDDMNGRHNQSRQFLEALPFYDYFITTKSLNVNELVSRGCPRVLRVENGYDPAAFRPMPVGPREITRLGGDIGFVGAYERERATSMSRLAERGFRVRVWGYGWKRIGPHHPNLVVEHAPLLGDDFATACSAFKINLGFLRKLNRDTQTTRSVEIPACGGFMLAERTAEHSAMFREGEEAEFFGSFRELESKCERYLRDTAARTEIARRGRERCLASGYSNSQRLTGALRAIAEETGLR
ncbi:hypothetical protein BH11GEM2_BH11GEM2_26040 [soil metagenome]